MKHCTVVVIGHVDHGKTALVRALTGIETDRLKEERERGLSIALGFAWRDYPSGGVDFVDAPGHEDFIRTTVSGAAGAQAAVLVISAVDGFERQTHEHLRIASLLGIMTGVVAVTKSDLLAADQIPARTTEIERSLIGTALEGEPIVFCSARTGAGLDELNDALDALVRRCPPAPALPGFLLPVDRVFNVHGAGTVVTGALLGAALDIGAEGVIQPRGRPVTVRGLQSRGVDRARVEAGRRTAVNLRGASVEDISPGDLLCAPGAFAPSKQIDGRVSLLPAAARSLKNLDDVRLLIGTRSVVASVRILDAKAIEPGDGGWVQLRCASPVLSFTGQRGILRRLSPAETIGGVIVLHPMALPTAKRNAPRITLLEAVERGQTGEIASALAARDGGVMAVEEVMRLTHLGADTIHARLAADFAAIGAGSMTSRRSVRQASDAYLKALSDAHRKAPARSATPLSPIRRDLARVFAPALVVHAEETLAAAGTIILARGHVALAGHDPLAALGEDQLAEMRRVEALLRDGGVSPPEAAEIVRSGRDGQDLVDLLIETGRVVALENYALRKTLLFHVEALEQAHARLSMIYPSPGFFRTGQAREALATSRKFIVPVLEYFDAKGWTRREGDLRQISPAAPVGA